VSEVVIELSDEDEPEGSTSPVGAAPAAPVISTTPTFSITPTVPDFLRPSTPCTIGWPDTSRDEEIARKLFVELNHEASGIPGDGGLVILSSDDEEAIEEEEEEVKDEPICGGSPSRSSAAPILSASPLRSLVTIGGGVCSACF
jgi:hypothetical protein